MAENTTGAVRANGPTPGIRSATTPCNPECSATPRARQARAPAVSILSNDDSMGNRDIVTVSFSAAEPRTAVDWLARRAGIGLGHASALAEVHGIGGGA